MEIVKELADQALQEALAKYPQYAESGARIIARPLFKGHAFVLEYDNQPAKDDPDAWEFQNAAVKAYRRLAGV